MRKRHFTLRSPRDIRRGQDMYFDAWLYSMMMDNNIAHNMNPGFIASDEQVGFMVALEKGQVYLPCSDETFRDLLAPEPPQRLRALYNRAWRIIVRLIREQVTARRDRQWLLQCCRLRFSQMTGNGCRLVPQRLVKRLTDLVLGHSPLADPWLERRREQNRRSLELLQSPEIQRALNALPPLPHEGGLAAVREEMHHVELARLMFVSAMSRSWLSSTPSPLTLKESFDAAVAGAGELRTLLCDSRGGHKTVLFLCDADGGVVFDLALVRALLRLGHRVIVALKSGFYFYAPTIGDIEADPTLKTYLSRVSVVRNPALSKNELLRLLREFRMVVIADGTRERLNLYRTSVTFARAWKEADLVIAKGWRNADVLMHTAQEFTRDIVCYWVDDAGAYHVQAKPHAPSVHKFSEVRLMDMADAIINEMREARRAGKSVMFYSCVIGSIPGQTSTAIQVARTFVEHLRSTLAETFVVNPSEHFADGMDGDDLMFMWERVQRSGCIDVWRFQTVHDIETSFALMGRKVPPVWAGKDSTFSTGCTKEMRIALDVQKRNHEMQIIGPDPENFFRRDEYGVGRYFDARISRDA